MTQSPPLEPKDELDEILFRVQHQRKLGTFRIDLAKQALQSYIEKHIGVELKELNDYIEYLIELTLMPHELSPRGYTDPDMKNFRLGQRDSLKRIQSYISRTPKLESEEL